MRSGAVYYCIITIAISVDYCMFSINDFMSRPVTALHDYCCRLRIRTVTTADTRYY